MGKTRVYPEWFIEEIADEDTKYRFLNGLGKVEESIYFKCPKGHPDYKQIVKNHISTKGEHKNICPICARERMVSRKYPSWLIDDLIDNNDKEMVSNSKYPSSKRLLFKCTKCGVSYVQSLQNHLVGKRMCLSCSRKQRGKSYIKTMALKRKPYPQWFIDELVNEEDKKRALSGELSGTEKILFKCLANEDHKNYIQEVKNHICISTGNHKCGCPECRYLKSSVHLRESYKNKRKNFPASIYEDIANPSDKELLRKRELSYNSKIDFLCPICGNTYNQMIKDHLRGKRCAICAGFISQEEIKVRDLIKSIYTGPVIYNSRSILGNFELDIYLPSKKIGIEYNGSFWHRFLPEGDGSKNKYYHLDKFDTCAKKGIQLISIFDVDMLSRKNQVILFLRDLLTSKEVIYARKCVLKKISIEESNSMYAEYHLLGETTNISVSYGLFYNNELFSCMSFQKGRYKNNNKPVWCLTRFVTKSGYTIVGGASKLLHQFEREYSPDLLVTYSDNDYFMGTVYENMGFQKFGYTKTPRYYWYLDGKEYKRESCQLKILSKQYPDLFEEARNILGNKEDFIMLHLGSYKVFRSGNTKWVKTYKENNDEEN